MWRVFPGAIRCPSARLPAARRDRRGPIPLATPDARYGPRSAQPLVPSLPRAVRRQPVLSALAAPDEPGRGPGGVREVDDRGIEPRFTAVSERRLPSRPVVVV